MMALSADKVKIQSPPSLPSPVWTFRDETPSQILGYRCGNVLDTEERPLKRIKWTIPASFPKPTIPPTLNSPPASRISSSPEELSGTIKPHDLNLGLNLRFSVPPSPVGPRAHSQLPTLPQCSWHLPSFLKPLPPNFSSEDVKYLSVKGALSVPRRPLRMALLQAFVEHVHPYMPILDLFGFLAAIEESQTPHTPSQPMKGASQISLLLFQAVMFAATAFVDVKHLHAAGFTSRKEARRLYFQKTRLLYDFDYESDRVTLIQVLLLMTFWTETLDDEKDAWHWIGVAVSLAETIGMSHWSGTARTPMQKLWRRIWWVCFVQDQMVVLGLRRSPRIDRKNFKAPPLVESDFDIRLLEVSYSVLPQQCVLTRDTDMQREVAQVYMAKAQLCSSLSRMLELQYSMQPRGAINCGNSTGSFVMLSPRPSIEGNAAKDLDSELQEWNDHLPLSCQYQIPTKADIENGRVAITLQRALLQLLYNTAIITLHRPWAQSRMDGDGVDRGYARSRIIEAAANISHIASDLKGVGAERLLPATGVTVLMQAVMTHLLDMKDSLTTKTYQNAVRGFKQCTSVLECLRETYSSADAATEILHAALVAQQIVKSRPPSVQPETGQLTPTSQSEWTHGGGSTIDTVDKSDPLASLGLILTSQEEEDTAWLSGSFEDALNALVDATYADSSFVHDDSINIADVSGGGEPDAQDVGAKSTEEAVGTRIEPVVKAERGDKRPEVEVDSQ